MPAAVDDARVLRCTSCGDVVLAAPASGAFAGHEIADASTKHVAERHADQLPRQRTPGARTASRAE